LTGAAATAQHLISWGTSNVEILAENRNINIDTAGTKRLEISTAGSYDVDSKIFDLDATGVITITSSYDNGTTTDSITLETTAATNGGDIKIASARHLYFTTNSTTVATFTSGSNVIFGATTKISTGGETAPDVSDGGLCLYNGTDGGALLTLKNDYVSNPFSTYGYDSDTYAAFQKTAYGGVGTAGGGLRIRSFNGYTDTTESNRCSLLLEGFSANPPTAADTTAYGVITLRVYDTNGTTGVQNVATTDNMYVLRNSSTTRMFITGDGRVYNDYATTMTTFDAEDDLALLRAAQLNVGARQAENIAMKRLEELGIIKNGFACQQDLNRLQMGAMHQLFNGLKFIAKKLGISELELSEKMIT